MVGVESSSTDDAEDVVLAHDQVRLIVDLDFGAAVFRNENLVPFLHGEIDLLAVVIDFTGAKSDDFALLRFFLRGIGNNDPALFHFLLFNWMHYYPIAERFHIDCCHRFYFLLLVFLVVPATVYLKRPPTNYFGLFLLVFVDDFELRVDDVPFAAFGCAFFGARTRAGFGSRLRTSLRACR